MPALPADTLTLKLNPRACARRLRLLIDVSGGGQVFGGETERLKDCDLVRGGAARVRARQQLAEFGADVIAPDRAFAEREQIVARFRLCGFAAVNEECGGGDGRRVQ